MKIRENKNYENIKTTAPTENERTEVLTDESIQGMG